ncbi:hypothetical protein V5O48_017833, partial [Marasmius crinis-equi]
MVQISDAVVDVAGKPSTPSTVLDKIPPAKAVHTYDRDRDTATTRFTLDYPGGLVVTTTVEIRLRHPNGYSVTVSNPDGDAPTSTSPATAPPLPPYLVPLPTSFVRPANESLIRRYYVVYVGKEVGIFTGEFDTTVAPLVRGVHGNKVEGFSTFDDAVYQYARAYQELRPLWPIRVVGSNRPVQFDPNYHWGAGTMLGSVDITGLDLDPAF